MYLTCLGQPLLYSNGDLVRFRTKKHLALLVFLAIECRRPHRRDRLAELLWSHAQANEARHSLATALSVLRPRVGPGALQTTRDTVFLTPGCIQTDVDRLLLGDVLPGDIAGSLDVESFLEGFEIPGAVDFSLWKDAQQARLLPSLKAALRAQLGWSRRVGDTRQMEELADRMLSLDELSEDAIRAKMEARALSGDRLMALRIFEEWKARLEHELRAKPSDLVEGMAVRLRRRGLERTTLTHIPPVRTDHWRDRPFVGRRTEYQILYDAWQGAHGGAPTQALVLGDSGVGKTTIIDRIATASALEGSVVSRIQCYDLDRELPYAALGMIVHGLLDSPGVSGTPPESLAELARTVPEVRRRFGSIPATTTSQGETARIRLGEAFFDLLQAVSEDHPIILVVDDAHQADDASLAVLQLIMRRSVDLRLFLILAARVGDPRSAELRNALLQFDQPFKAFVVEVPPLSSSESSMLLQALAPVDQPLPPRSVQDRLIVAAAGIPMALELLYQDWTANGDHSLSLSIDAMTAEPGGNGQAPAFYSDILGRLARALPASTQSVLNLSAILGHRLNDISLYEIVDLGIGGTMTGITDLVSRRVLRDSGKGLEFVNELVRAASYLQVPSALRRLLHSSVADRLIAKHRLSTERLGLEIAWHCMRGGRTCEATSYLLHGARDALRVGAAQEAERALVSAIPSISGEALQDASILLAEVLYEQGRAQEALDLLSEHVLQSQGGNVDRAIALAALAKKSLSTTLSHGLYEELPRLEQIVLSTADPSTKVLAGRAMAYIVGDRRDHQMAGRVLSLLSSIPMRDLDVDAFGQLALARALLLYSAGSALEAYRTALVGSEELERRGAANLVKVQLLGGLGSIRLREGRYREAVEHYRAAMDLAVRLGNDRQIAMTAGNISLCCGRLGLYVDQLDWANRVPKPKTADLSGFVEIQVAYCMASASAVLGQPDKACSIMASMDQRLAGPVPAWMIQAWGLWKADILAMCGLSSAAESLAIEILEKYEYELQTPAFAGPFARWLSRTAAGSGASDRAVAIVGRLMGGLQEFDELDQVEILCSWTSLVDSESAASHLQQLEDKLECLPRTIADHLRRQGFLQAILNPSQSPEALARPADAP
jgi:DNA-binding SARP family transcriptional activator/tetratricopeptide (TPR) repeat protein